MCVFAVPLFMYIWGQYQLTREVLKDDQGATSPLLPNLLMKTFDNPLGGTYEIDGQDITFTNGTSEQEIAPGSASRLVSRIFGVPAYADLNNDGKNDAVFFLTQTSGGSGTFFYVAAAINVGEKYKGTNAVLLGDRISPQTINVSGGVVAVNYAIRGADEPMSVAPSVGVTKYFYIKDGSLIEKTATSTYLDVFDPIPSSPVGPVYSSNIVGYIAGGAFIIDWPNWVTEHWETITKENGDLVFTPNEVVVNRDFSDIVLRIGTTTETFNADSLYDHDIKETLTERGEVLISETLFNKFDSRMYHVQRLNDGRVHDVYYVDGNNKSAIVTFDVDQNDYAVYGAKVKEFVQGIGKGASEQG